ncbi:MAG: NADH-quinone oxidoreductase subunit C [Anaerolinea sp.]|nr:NADH-quinone oxidoreductase subunit C [Anaerolinea sp.]
MNELLNPAVFAIQARFNGQVSEFRGDVTILVPSEKIIAAATALRDEFDFDILSAETAVDYCPQTAPRFHMVYIFYSTKTHLYLTFRAPVNGDDPKIATMETVFPNANWREREIWDLMGIRFEGHSDLRRLLLPPNWVGHPLRKDYPLGYEEVQYTFNFDDIDLRKPKGVR